MNNREYISSFLRKANSNRMLDFYKDLHTKGTEDKFDAVVFATEKSFYVYKLLTGYVLEEGLDSSIALNEVPCYTDVLNTDVFYQKRICLVCDVLMEERLLFQYYCILKHFGASKVLPFVFAVSTEFPNKEEKPELIHIARTIMDVDSNQAAELYDEFIDSVRGFRYISSENIARFCLNEMELLYKCLGECSINSTFVIKSKNSFTKGNDEWVYVPNVYKGEDKVDFPYQVAGQLNYDVDCGYFCFSNSLIEHLKNHFLYSTGMKCKCIVEQDNIQQLVLEPFVFMRSIKKQDLLQIFNVFSEEANCKFTEKISNDENDVYIWTTIMTFVEYTIKEYVCKCFKEYLVSHGSANFTYNQSFVESNSYHDLFSEIMQLDCDNIMDRLMDCQFETTKDAVFLRNNLSKFPYMNNVYDCVYPCVISAHENNNEAFTVEDIENLLTKNMFFDSDYNLEQVVTSILLMLQELGSIKRKDTVDLIKGNASWKYISDNTATLLLPGTGKCCYLCAEALYICLSEESYTDKIKNLLIEIGNYIFESGLLSKEDADSFYYYVDYFCRHKDNSASVILGKEFLFDRLSNQEKEIHNYAVWFAEREASQK